MSPIIPKVALILALIVLLIFIGRLGYVMGMSLVFDSYYGGLQ